MRQRPHDRILLYLTTPTTVTLEKDLAMSLPRVSRNSEEHGLQCVLGTEIPRGQLYVAAIQRV